MAPNGHKASQRRDGHQSHKSSCQSWLKTKGQIEFEEWRADNPTQQLSYEDWTSSKHVAGLSLFFAAADIFDESDSTDDDEEGEPVEVKPRPRAVRTQSAREPKKKVTTNGNGTPRAASSATPTARAHSDELSPSSKRKRKAKKSFLSEEVIASDGESDADQRRSTALTEQAGATPTVPDIAVNGKRRSSARKSKKKVLSEEMVSPEDELDDPMVLDEVVPPPIASPLPVRSAPKAKAKATAQTPVQTSEPPRKTHILKLSTRKAPKELELPKEDGRFGDIYKTMPPALAWWFKHGGKSRSDLETDNTAGSKTPTQPVETGVQSAAGSPNPTDLSASATRRGLRTRRPAQQRPYYHDAQLFDDVEPENSSPGNPSTAPSELRSRRASAVSFVSKPYDDRLLAHLDAEDLAILQDDAEDEEVGERRPKTFKGKGRAWKKEESDEDEEFTVARKKAAKAARAKAKSQAPVITKKRGRPRKSALSDDMVRDDSEMPDAISANGSPAPSLSPAAAAKDGARKTRKPSRKSLLSAEIVEDSDSDVDVSLNTVSVPGESVPAPALTPKLKKTVKAMDSDQSTTPRGSVRQQDAGEAVELITSATPVDAPSKIHVTPRKTISASQMKNALPAKYLSSLSDAKEGAEEGSDAGQIEPVDAPSRRHVTPRKTISARQMKNALPAKYLNSPSDAKEGAEEGSDAGRVEPVVVGVEAEKDRGEVLCKPLPAPTN
ncbi:hypothetical protein T440DRAFT_478613 [Plenodomus tracheiphilus IPT5]|uniref:Uncharacterized protein n=1 Tax=Plenodomus tracheiphilus IPT5 TaxID=1408161 RepID=A0A6A7B8U4_9PLEO|nr:hypothetical protein T440DRAFT_478613 [Plenodomus tracheiphilus IPT5]